MRLVLSCVAILCIALSCSAQKGGWAAVEGLPSGTAISVKTKYGNFQGELDSADPEKLVIWSHEHSFPGRIVVKRELTREDVKLVRINHPFASAAVGAAIGAGIGIGLGAAVDARARSNEDKGLAGAVFGILGGGLGAILGKTHPFIKGTPIYIAP